MTFRATTPEAIIVYPDLFEPTSFNDSPELFRCLLLFEKDADLSEVKAVIAGAAKRKFPSKDQAFYQALRHPIRNGADKAVDDRGNVDPNSFYYNRLFMNPKSKFQPQVINLYGKPISDQTQIYGGCKVRASLDFYGYEYMGNKGVGVSLQAIVKIDDGEPLGGGKVDVQKAFEGVLKQRSPVIENGTIDQMAGEDLSEFRTQGNDDIRY